MLNKNDRVIIKASEESGTITNIFNVEGTTYYELEDRVKAYTREELLLYQVTVEEQRQTFETPIPLDINAPIITADAIKADASFVDKLTGDQLAIELTQRDTDPVDEEPTITISVKDYEAYNKDKDVLDTIKALLNK